LLKISHPKQRVGQNLTILDTPRNLRNYALVSLVVDLHLLGTISFKAAPLVSWANAPAAVQSPSWQLQEDNPEWSFHRGECGKIKENNE